MRAAPLLALALLVAPAALVAADATLGAVYVAADDRCRLVVEAHRYRLADATSAWRILGWAEGVGYEPDGDGRLDPGDLETCSMYFGLDACSPEGDVATGFRCAAAEFLDRELALGGTGHAHAPADPPHAHDVPMRLGGHDLRGTVTTVG